MDTETLTYRLANYEDTNAIVELVNRAYRDSSVRGWTSECDIVSGNRTHHGEIESLISTAGSTVVVMSQQSRLHGCVHLQGQGPEIYLGMLTVDPQIHNRGLGKGLLSEAERYAQEHMEGKAISMIVVSQRTELIDFYLRRGYRRSGEILAYPIEKNVGRPKVDGLTMEKLVKDLNV